jgi:hypothetical protein
MSQLTEVLLFWYQRGRLEAGRTDGLLYWKEYNQHLNVVPMMVALRDNN